MDWFVNQTSGLLGVVVQIIVIVIPIVLSWFVRTYINSNEKREQLGVIVQLANSAIDYAEDLDKRGDLGSVADKLDISDDRAGRMSKGLQKLNVASTWLTDELKRFDVDVEQEDAKKWIASEFRHRLSNIAVTRPAAEIAVEVTKLLDELEARKLVILPKNTGQAVEFTGFLANWIVNQLGESDKGKKEFQREEATNILKEKLLTNTQSTSSGLTPVIRGSINDIAQSAVAYVMEIKSVRPLPASERDLAIARTQMEATRQGLTVSIEEIGRAVDAALAEQRPT